jgi:hypothetical protein
VQSGGNNYVCILAHHSSSHDNEPPNSTYWLRGTPPIFYRSRDNYIWAFFADAADHTTHDIKALPGNTSSDTADDTRSAKALFPDSLTDYSPIFPLTDVQRWDAANDDFTLAKWDSHLNTDVDSSLLRMGKGKEENAIIRTKKWGTGSYSTACSSFPREIGIFAQGHTAMEFAFDDLAYRILQGVSGSSGTPSAGYYGY